jgi:hypothetical protein
MSAFADYARTAGAREATRRRIGELLAKTRFLFPDDDPWFRAATALYDDTRPKP